MKQKKILMTIGLVTVIFISLSISVYSQETNILKIKQEIAEKGTKQIIKEIDKSPPISKVENIKLLGELKDPGLVKPIIEKFLEDKSESEEVRIAAVFALGEMGYPQGIMSLLDALGKDRSMTLRLEVISALGKIGSIISLESLMDQLNDPESEIQIAARKSIILIGKPAIPSLISALETNNKALVRRHAAVALGEIGTADVINPLLSALEDEDPDVFEEAAIALGKIDLPEAMDQLMLKYSNSKSGTYQQKLETAIKIIGKPAVDPLLKLMRTAAYESIRDKAANMLIKIGSPATEGMVLALGDWDKKIRKSTADALDALQWRPKSPEEKAAYCIAVENWEDLKSLGDVAVDPLIAVLPQFDPLFNKNMVTLLGESASPKIVGPFVKIIKGDYPVDVNLIKIVKTYIVTAKNPTDVNALIEAASLPTYEVGNREIVNWASGILYTLKDTNAIPVYRKMASEGSIEAANVLLDLDKPEEIINGVENVESAKFSIVRRLGMIKDARLVEPIVIHFLNDLKEDIQVRYSAAMALGQIGDQSAVKPLIETMKNDHDGSIRSSAAKALGEIGSPDAVEPLIEVLLNDTQVWTRVTAAYALGILKDERALDPLLTARKEDNDNTVKYQAGLALLEMKHPGATDFYIEILSCNNPEMRLKAAMILLDFKDPKALKVRGQALQVVDSDSYITEETNFNEYGYPASLTLKNIFGEDVAKKTFMFNQYNPTQKTGETITDITTGSDIHVTVYNNYSNPTNQMWLCLDKMGNIIKRAGKPLLVKPFIAQQNSEFKNIYNGAFIDKRITKIYQCQNCAGQTSIKNCRFVW